MAMHKGSPDVLRRLAYSRRPRGRLAKINWLTGGKFIVFTLMILFDLIGIYALGVVFSWWRIFS